MSGKYTKYKPEFRDEIAKLIVESGRSIAEVAREYGLNETTVGGWVKKYRAAHGADEAPLELPERARAAGIAAPQERIRNRECVPKKSSSALREGATVTDKFGFIAAECAADDDQALPTIARMCLLLGVSKSGFYEWLRRPVSAAQRRRELLADKVKALFEAFGATYGYRRIHAELVRAGERVGPELVRKLMGEMGLDSFAAPAFSYHHSA